MDLDLVSLADGYLNASGYRTTKFAKHLLRGTKRSIAEEKENVLVWIPPFHDPQSFGAEEKPYLSRFDEAMHKYPDARKFVLFPTLEGLSPSFRSEALKYNVHVRVPIQFFDTSFKADESPRETLSVVGELRRRGEERRRARVPQPYELVKGTGKERPGDLLDTLTSNIKAGSAKAVNLVVGPAGIGKTVLFEVLFADLYRTLLKYKKRMQVFPRPLPVLPEHLQASSASNLTSLVEGFLHTDFAAPITRSTFEWMLTNGFGIWLLDGLDEIVDRDPNFFTYLLDILTKPGAKAPIIVLCLRDSLLSSNEDLKDFCDEFEHSIAIYELSRWDDKSKRLFAQRHLNGETDKFLMMLQTRAELSDLSSVPYYCELILGQYRAGGLQEPYSESHLLDSALSNIIKREYGKGLLDVDFLPELNLLEMLEDLAAEDMMRDFQGLDRLTIKEYAEMVLPSELDEARLSRLITHVVQLPVFCKGRVAGNVQFAQEILEQYLLGTRLYRIYSRNMEGFIHELSVRAIPTEWITLKTVAEKLRLEGSVSKLLNRLQRPSISGNAFRNALQICAFAIDEPSTLKGILLEGKDISGVKFKELDLCGFSFRGCNLTDVEFDQCLLRDAKFEGAIIKNTAFLLRKKEEDLKGARFGDMERFHSLRPQPGRKLETDYGVVKNWLAERTAIVPEMHEPCPAAKQLRYLFGKFVYPNGIPKRAVSDRPTVLAGKKFHDPEGTLHAVVRHGYLIEEKRPRACMKRPAGELYRDMVSYVVDLTTSARLRTLLDEICPIIGCEHMLPERETKHIA